MFYADFNRNKIFDMEKSDQLSVVMHNMTQMYDFLAGPCLYITVPLCIAGLVRKLIVIISGRSLGLKFPVMQFEKVFPVYAPAGRDRALAAGGTIFHAAIFLAPLTARAHGILLDLAWAVLPPRIDPAVTRVFTLAAILSGLYLVARRTFVRHVFAVSSWKDYASMICVLIPFVTGLLAGELVGAYETVMVIHCASAHILLLAIGWTRLGHMVFFISGRLASSDIFNRAEA